jgi:hypothetical protein
MKNQIAIVVGIVCEHFGCSRRDLLSARRNANLVRPRHIAQHLAVSVAGARIVDVASFFDRDHTSVIHASRAVTQRAEVDESFRAELNSLAAKTRAAIARFGSKSDFARAITDAEHLIGQAQKILADAIKFMENFDELDHNHQT